MVLNTQCFPYLWLLMWFHAKKIQRKKCWLSYVDSAPRLRNYQKYPKKTLHSLLSPFLSLLKSYYVLITFITINVIIITGQRLYSVDVRRQCTSMTMGVTERCRLLSDLFFEIIRDNFFCNLSSLTANNLLFYICSQSQLLIKEEIQSKWVWHEWW